MTAAEANPLSETRRLTLGRRARLLAMASVSYNVLEAVVAIAAGAAAGSVALVGFGLDSTVEVASGLIIIWQFSHRVPEAREQRALRMLAASFFALAGYVGFESARALIGGADPDPSRVGIGLAVLSLAVMPALSWAQRRTGRQLGSRAVVADGTQTLLCTYLSAVLLAGLVLNATLGWSWADPLAGMVIAAVAAREGLEAWRGEGCCGTSRDAGEHPDEAPDQCGCSLTTEPADTAESSADVQGRARPSDADTATHGTGAGTDGGGRTRGICVRRFC